MAKVAILVPGALVATIATIAGATLVSYSPATRLGVESLIACWSAIPAAVAFVALQKRTSLGHALLASALVLPMLIHIDNAMYVLTISEWPEVPRPVWASTGSALELALVGLLLLVTTICSEPSVHMSRVKRISLACAIILAPTLFRAGVWYFVLPALEVDYLGIGAVACVIVGITCYSVASLRIITGKNREVAYDRGYFTAGAILSVIALSLLGYTVYNPGMSWVYAENVYLAAFLLLGMSVGIPFLKRTGLRKRTVYTLYGLLVTMTYLPVLLTTSAGIILEGTTVTFPDYLAYAIIHFGAGSLCAMMSYLIYTYSKVRFRKSLYPLLLLFGLWGTVGAVSVLVAFTPAFVIEQEVLVPYLNASLLTIPLLCLVGLWSGDQAEQETSENNGMKLFAVVVALFLVVFLGEAVYQAFIPISLHESPAPEIALLGSNLVIMFLIAYLVFLLSSQSGASLSFETYVTGFLTIWVVPNMLKSYYATWTAGWWVSELFILVGLLVGPALLALLYMRAMSDVEDSQRRAGLYADLLMHDITNYNQMTFTALELLGQGRLEEQKEAELIDDARKAVTLSEQLISNVRLLSFGERLAQVPRKPVDLVSTAVRALDALTQTYSTQRITFRFSPEMSRAYVIGNDSLLNVFVNLLYAGLEYTDTGGVRSGEFVLDIAPSTRFGDDWWAVRLRVPNTDSSKRKRRNLLDAVPFRSGGGSLGLLVARMLTEAVDGFLDIQAGENELVFCLHLPVARDMTY